MRIIKRICFVLLLAAMPLLMAQTGPTVFTPRLTVSPGPLLVTTGNTDVQNLIIHGTCTGCVGAANFANPTGTIGLTAVNGVATTGIRSDGAPALSQAIVPTWTGIHTFDAIPNFNGGASSVSPPFTVDSNTTVTNLNADMLDGISSGGFCQTGGTGCPSGFTGLANPTGTIGLTAVNGSATTALRSDGAPALSQAITPTWTGAHIFTANAPAISINAASGQSSGINLTPNAAGSGTAVVANVGAAAAVLNDAAAGDLALRTTTHAIRLSTNGGTSTNWLLDSTGNVTQTGVGTFTQSATVPATYPIFMSSADPFWAINETDGAANNRLWDFGGGGEALLFRALTDAGSAVTWLRVDRTGSTVDTVNLQATSVQKNGVEIATYETGSFTVNYGNACTTTPSQTWDYIKIGNQVTIKLDSVSGFPCTGDTTAFSSGAVPAALIPPDNALSPMFGDGGCQDNGTVVQCAMSISGGLGLMAIGDCTGGGACNATGWQAAGNRSGPALGVTWTYSLDP